MTKGTNTEPLDDSYQDKRTHLTVAATWKDPATGALYVHQDLTRVLEDVYADRVHAARALLGEDFDLLRAADA